MDDHDLNDIRPTPIIGGVAFPWMITADGYSFTVVHNGLPMLRLAFFAERVHDERTTDLCNFAGDIVRSVPRSQ